MSVNGARQTGSDILWFLYDSDGTRVGCAYNGAAYYYTTNAQRDLTGITDSSCNKVVEYTYDAWGKLLSTTGTLAGTIGMINPFLYRGYYYDSETGLYYLNSRYYDPQTGRFLNADDTAILEATQEEFLSINLFAYCNNNPIMKIDIEGHLGRYWWNSVKVVGIALDILIIAISAGRTYFDRNALKAFLKAIKNKLVYQIRGKILQLFGSVVGHALPAVIDIAMTLAGTSPGQLIAKGLDYIDSWWGYKRNNGYILVR